MNRCLFRSILVGWLMLVGCQSPQWGSALSKKSKFSNAKIPEITGKNGSSNQAAGRVRTADQVGQVTFSAGNTAGSESGVELVEHGRAGVGRTDSKWINDNLTRGDREFREHRLDKAKDYYREVLKREPDHPTAHHRLAIIADMQQDFGVAEYHYRIALKGNPTDPTLLSDLGWSYIQQRKYHDAETVLSEALAFDRTHRKALDRLGYLYAQQGDYDRALEMFRRGASETDAQAKIAQLFPNGRPPADHSAAQPSALAALRSPFSGPDRSFEAPPPNRGTPEPWPYAASNTPSSPPGPQSARRNIQGAPNDITRGLKERMEQERMRGVAARNQQPAGGSSGAVPYAAFPGNPNSPSSNAFGSLDASATASSYQTSSPYRRALPEGTALSDQNWPVQELPTQPATSAGAPRITPTGFENSDSTIQPWPFAPKGNDLHSSRESLQTGQYDPAPIGTVPGNTSFGTQPAGAQSASSRRAAAYLGMNAGPSRMFPIVNSQAGSPRPVPGAAQPETESQRNGSQFASPANVASGWPTSRLPVRQYGATPSSVQQAGRTPSTAYGAPAVPRRQESPSALTNRFARQTPGYQAAWPGLAPAITPASNGSRATPSAGLTALSGDTRAALPTPQYNQLQYSQPQQYQPQFNRPQFNQPQFNQPQFNQPQYGQPQYSQPQYGQPYQQR